MIDLPTSPFAKAIAPLVLGLISVITQWVITHTFNTSEFVTALSALTTSIVVFLVPNAPRTVEDV